MLIQMIEIITLSAYIVSYELNFILTAINTAIVSEQNGNHIYEELLGRTRYIKILY